jgi:hypothetical protein
MGITQTQLSAACTVQLFCAFDMCPRPSPSPSTRARLIDTPRLAHGVCVVLCLSTTNGDNAKPWCINQLARVQSAAPVELAIVLPMQVGHDS